MRISGCDAESVEAVLKCNENALLAALGVSAPSAEDAAAAAAAAVAHASEFLGGEGCAAEEPYRRVAGIIASAAAAAAAGGHTTGLGVGGDTLRKPAVLSYDPLPRLPPALNSGATASAAPGATSAASVQPLPFKGVVVYLDHTDPLGFSAKRIDIIAGKLREGGADVVDSHFNARLTHVVTTSSVFTSSTEAAVVSPDWASACIKAQSLVPTDNYLPSSAVAPLGEQHMDSTLDMGREESVPGQSLGRKLPRETLEPGASRETIWAAKEKREARVDAQTEAAAGSVQGGGADGRGARELVSVEPEFRAYLGRVKANLACQNGGPDGKNPNKNAHITDLLEELAEIYEDVLGGIETYKAKQHKQAAKAIKDLNFTVSDERHLADPETGRPILPFFAKESSSVRQKVVEIIGTGRLKKLDELKGDPRVMALKDLTTVWGIGAGKARDLYNNGKGFKSVAELRKAVDAGATDLLSPQQLVGLRHHWEFQQRMPRDEAAAIGEHVRKAAEAAAPGCSVTLAGSFRRGKATCGDLDVLISPSEAWMYTSACDRRKAGGVGEMHEILPEVLRSLHANGVLTADLTKVDGFERGTGGSYMGVARLPRGLASADGIAVVDGSDAVVAESKAADKMRMDRDGEGGGGGDDGCSSSLALAMCQPQRLHRRIDIKVYRPEELPFALLYFTGSGYFNRSMRWWADKKGISLNDKCFKHKAGTNYKVAPPPAGFKTEADVFEFLELEYVRPEDRSV